MERLGRRAEGAAKRAVEKNVEDVVDRAVDGAFDEGEETGVEESTEKADENKKPKKQSPEMAYAKSDFVSGDEIIFDDDVTREQLGEFPSQWNLEGSAEIALPVSQEKRLQSTIPLLMPV